MVAIVLLTIISYYTGMDTGYRDYRKLYMVWTQPKMENESRNPSPMSFGPFSQHINEELSDLVESSTVVTNFYSGGGYFKMDGQEVNSTGVAADSLFFTTMGIEVLKGNPSVELARPGTAFVSTNFVKENFPGGDPIGKHMRFFFDSEDVEIVGVYKSLPPNTSTRPDIVLSMPTVYKLGNNYIGHGWDDQLAWQTLLRVKKGTDIEVLNKKLNNILQKNRPEVDGLSYEAMARPINYGVFEYEYTRNMIVILLSTALIVLFIAILNYALLSVSSLSKRAKMIGVHKCNGAGKGTIFSMFIAETTLIVLMSLVVTVATAALFKPMIAELYNDSFGKTPLLDKIIIALVVIAVTIIVGGVIPAHIFAKIPVANVFRRFRERNSLWKRILLFIEFAGVAFVMAWLVIITAQYIYISNKDRGWNIHDKALFMFSRYDPGKMDGIINLTRNMPYIEETAYSAFTPVWGHVGEDIYNDEGNAMFYSPYDEISENYIDVMGMTLLQGRAPKNVGEAVVNQTFIKKMNLREENLLDRNPNLTVGTDRHNRQRIVGIIKDYQQSFNEEIKPLIMYYAPEIVPYISIKLKEPFNANYNKLEAEIKNHYPESEYDLVSYKSIADDQNSNTKIIQRIFLSVAVIIALIAFVGLTGFLRDEMQRRSKEIAIRKISGASSPQIIKMITSGMLWIAVPAVVLGTVAAFLISGMWLDSFSVKVPYLTLYYVISAIVVLTLIVVCAVAMTRHKACENPSSNLKSE